MRLLTPWDFPDKCTGVGCHFLLQEIFSTQGLNPDLPHCRQKLYHLSHQGSPLSKVIWLKYMGEVDQCDVLGNPNDSDIFKTVLQQKA